MRSLKLTILGLLLYSLLLSSCQRKFLFTRDSIYYSGWAKGEYQGFKIAKIKLLDSAISISNSNFNPFKLTDYVIDSSFCYGAGRNKGPNNNMPKIHFSNENDLFIWYK